LIRYAPAGGAVLCQPCGRVRYRARSAGGICCVLLAEVDLVFRAAEPEPQRFVCWASIKVVFEFDTYPLRHHGLRDRDELSAPYKINRHPVTTAPPVSHQPESMHPRGP
jgi:hypothetical protein